MGVGRAGELLTHRLAGEHPGGEPRELRGSLLGLHADRPRAPPPRPRAHQAGLRARLHQFLVAHRQVDRLQVQELLQRRDQLSQVEAVRRGRLLEQVVATDQVLGALIAELRDNPLDLLAH